LERTSRSSNRYFVRDAAAAGTIGRVTINEQIDAAGGWRQDRRTSLGPPTVLLVT
jgi:hypothetical protein